MKWKHDGPAFLFYNIKTALHTVQQSIIRQLVCNIVCICPQLVSTARA